MIRALLNYARQHHVGLLALFVAMGGTAYAGVTANSVDTQHIRDNAVTAPKIARRAVTAQEIREGAVRRAEIGEGAVASEEVADGTLQARDLAPGAVVGRLPAEFFQLRNSLGDLTGGAATGSTAPNPDGTCVLGEMILVAHRLLPGSFYPANGQILAISEYEAMFSLLGTTYGGNGTSTFALPDLRPVTPNNMTWGICMYGIYPASS